MLTVHHHSGMEGITRRFFLACNLLLKSFFDSDGLKIMFIFPDIKLNGLFWCFDARQCNYHVITSFTTVFLLHYSITRKVVSLKQWSTE